MPPKIEMTITTILTVLAFYGLTFLLKDASILSRQRLWLAQRSRLIAEMLDCSFCTGFHAGILIYFLTKTDPFSWKMAFLYALASAAFSYAADTWLLSLEAEDGEDE